MGIRAASVVDLIAIGFSRREEDVQAAEPSSRKMLQRFQSLRGLSESSASDLSIATGLEGFEILRAQALMELGRRTHQAGRGPVNSIESPDDVLNLLDWMRGERREHFVAILIDTKGQILRVAQIHIGTLNSSLVGAREVFREAIRDGASSLVVAHNHPSGDPEPSPEDIEVTRNLVQIGKMLDIPILDHVIIGENRAVSLKRRGHVD